ncbi:MAG: hypothetical protein ISS94_02370 [Candidatus Syntrophoarchaeum sp.]|nr:hypothetical protein [Methanomicrobia archaeon]MBL7117615.1 hypothetical protein [Candidatus Syntrophoarchaeum sp.]
MPIKVEEIIEYAKEYKYKKTTSEEMLGDRLLGVFEGAIPKGKTSTDIIKEMRRERA